MSQANHWGTGWHLSSSSEGSDPVGSWPHFPPALSRLQPILHWAREPGEKQGQGVGLEQAGLKAGSLQPYSPPMLLTRFPRLVQDRLQSAQCWEEMRSPSNWVWTHRERKQQRPVPATPTICLRQVSKRRLFYFQFLLQNMTRGNNKKERARTQRYLHPRARSMLRLQDTAQGDAWKTGAGGRSKSPSAAGAGSEVGGGQCGSRPPPPPGHRPGAQEGARAPPLPGSSASAARSHVLSSPVVTAAAPPLARFGRAYSPGEDHVLVSLAAYWLENGGAGRSPEGSTARWGSGPPPAGDVTRGPPAPQDTLRPPLPPPLRHVPRARPLPRGAGPCPSEGLIAGVGGERCYGTLFDSCSTQC